MLRLYLCVFLSVCLSLTIAEDISESHDAAEESNSQEDSKEKRSQEEIMFGNQQNKPNGLVDDLMSMSENMEEPENKSNDSQAQDLKSEDGQEEEKRGRHQEDNQNDMMMASGAENWYNTIPSSPGTLHYLTNAQALKNIPAEDLYDQEDLYRRKRQILGHPLPLRKRSLRSSLGQMIQKRGIRLPRRSMRLKRQVDMEDLLNLFGNDRFYTEDSQVTPHIFSGRARTVSKRHVPGRFSGYPETPAPEYRYPYVFQHRGDGLLSPGNEMVQDDNEGMEDIDNLMLLPPNSQYIDTPQDIGLLPYRNREEESDAIQNWLTRHTTPSVFKVSRRSSPFFYPIDYRYVPGHKKRSRMSNGGGRFDEEEPEGDFGKWGHVVQVPEAYASPEDIARLYGLANLLSEGDDGEAKMRRSA